MIGDKGKEILIIKIDIGDGRHGDIIVHEFDEPEDLAKAFCQKYALDFGICDSLVSTIDYNIDQLILENNNNKTITPEKVLEEKTPENSHLRPSSRLSPDHPPGISNVSNISHIPHNPHNPHNTRNPRNPPNPHSPGAPGTPGTPGVPEQVVLKQPKSPYYEALKEDRFKTLFKLFNPSQEATISVRTLSKGSLPSKLAEVLSPIIEELEESEEEIDFEEFSKALDALISYLSPAEANLILSSRSNNAYSSKGNTGKRSSTPTYERLVDRNFQKEEKLKQERQKKLAEEIKECTFQPNVHRARPKRKFK